MDINFAKLDCILLITDHRVDSFRVDVFRSALGLVILAVCFGSDVKQGFFLGRSSS